jgi:hypothetical protein
MDNNMRVISPNARLEALLQKQNDILERIFDSLDQLREQMATDCDSMIDQNGSIKAKLDDAVLVISHVRDAIQESR